TIALACSHPDISFALHAKREISKLWEDISKAPYRALFNPGVTGRQLWKLVQIQRMIDIKLNEEHSVRPGREGMFAIHGNRFLAHQVFKRLKKDTVHDSEADLALLKREAEDLTITQLDRCTFVANTIFPDSYLASLFKNPNKCKDLDKSMA